MNQRQAILKVLESNSRISPAELAVRLGYSEEEVIKTIAELEADRIIVGYHTLINWDNPQRGQGFDRIAEKIYLFPEVDSLYLMSGGFDFLVELKKAPMKEIALFVSSRLSVIEEVQSTATHIILTKYKDHGTMFVKDDKHKRMVVTP